MYHSRVKQSKVKVKLKEGFERDSSLERGEYEMRDTRCEIRDARYEMRDTRCEIGGGLSKCEIE